MFLHLPLHLFLHLVLDVRCLMSEALHLCPKTIVLRLHFCIKDSDFHALGPTFWCNRSGICDCSDLVSLHLLLLDQIGRWHILFAAVLRWGWMIDANFVSSNSSRSISGTVQIKATLTLLMGENPLILDVLCFYYCWLQTFGQFQPLEIRRLPFQLCSAFARVFVCF